MKQTKPMNNNIEFEKLENHIGHAIEVVGYKLPGSEFYESCSVECIDCNEVIYSVDNNN